MKILLVIFLLLTSLADAQDIPGWEQVYNGPSRIGKIEFPSEAVGYAFIWPDTLMITKDTGTTWNKIRINVPDSLRITSVFDFSFFSEDKGYIGVSLEGISDSLLAIDALLKVSDYGATSTLIDLPDSFLGFYSIKFLSENYGICIIGVEDKYKLPIVVTFDGAKTWSKSYTDDFPIVVSSISSNGRYIDIADSSTWLMSYNSPCGAQSLCWNEVLTTDAGISWKGVECYRSSCIDKFIPLPLGYAYNLSDFGYTGANGFIHSPIFDVRKNIILDSMPSSIEYYSNSRYSKYKNGSVIIARYLYDKEYPIVIYISQDSCSTWKRYESQWDNKEYNISFSNAVLSSKNTGFISARLSDTATRTFVKSIIYRSRLDAIKGVLPQTSELKQLQPYPNPTGETLHWNVTEGTATISDAIGAEVLTIPAWVMQADISGLAIGVYYLTIRSGGESVTRVFTVMR